LKKRLKILRLSSQIVFFGLFVFIFVRSLDPFSLLTNPFLRFDPLIYLTHLSPRYGILLPAAGVLVLAFLTGRYYCGWVCPLGSLIEGLDVLLAPLRRLSVLRKAAFWLEKRFTKAPPAWFVLGLVIATVFFSPPILQFFHPNVWIVRVFSLSAAGIGFLLFLLAGAAVSRRLWCRYLCPLGALYGIVAKISLFRLSIADCSGCGRCDRCPMHAAEYGEKKIHLHQCILCFDYEHRCPVNGFTYGAWKKPDTAVDESRRNFLKSGAVAVSGILIGAVIPFFDRTYRTRLLRPPGVVDEPTFVERCLRCFQCVESCPNGIIRITGPGEGLDSLFTPHLSYRENGCDFNCQVCQIVCPNFAIPRQTLEEKQRSVIGSARIHRGRCVVYAQDLNCLVCEEFCPVPDKAIKVVEREKVVNGKNMLLRYPVVDRMLCIGCGLCEAFCPVEQKAIRVYRSA
jgi:polyferredoxin/NAD-dependent dihydropyrimidine dehydrogenase PreA subunit